MTANHAIREALWATPPASLLPPGRPVCKAAGRVGAAPPIAYRAAQALPLSELLGRRAAEANAFEYYEAKWGLDGCKIPPRRLPWTSPAQPAAAGTPEVPG